MAVMLKYFTTWIGRPLMSRMKRRTPIPAMASMQTFMTLLINLALIVC